ADIAEHVEFCARTGNHARALEIVQRHLPWLDRAPSPYAGMWFAASAALALRRAAATGHSGALRRPAAGDRPDAEVPVGELAEQLAAEALATAARFDARNGTKHQSERVQSTLDAGQLAERLPLSASVVRPGTSAPGASAAGAGAPGTTSTLAPPGPAP